jgi:putative toxin-antitoxin system antitoxin component (TIGR02293 family)
VNLRAASYRLHLIDGGEPTRSAIIGGKVTGKSLRELRAGLELTLAEVSAVLGTSERTVIRKEKTGEALTTSEADRAYRIARIADLAAELIGDADRAKAWMKKRHAFLGNEAPITMLDTEVGADLVVESLYAIAYGGTA